MALSRDKHKLVITVDNIGPADAIALKKMFEYMQYLGNIGSSRMCSFYADGDGSFRPKVSFDYPIELPEVPEVTGVVDSWNGSGGRPGQFIIDSDDIGWLVYHDPEPEGFVREKNPQEGALKASKENDVEIRAKENLPSLTKYKEWTRVSRFLASCLVGIDVREIDPYDKEPN